MSASRATTVAAVILALTGSVFADGKEPKPTAGEQAEATGAEAKPVASAEQIEKWVRNLNAVSAAVRDQATKELVKAGKPAIDPVARAAKGDSLEVTVRGISVLKALLSSDDEATRRSARAALEALAADTKHEAGKQDKEVLDQTAAEREDAGALMLDRLIGNIQITAVANAGPMRMSVRSIDGRSEIDVSENGRDIRIIEDKDGIVMKVTEKAEGNEKPKSKEYKAANAAQLKRKHPEAYKLYVKYAKQNARGVVINLGGLGQPLPAGRLPRRQVGVGPTTRPRLDPRKAGQLIDEARDELSKSVERLKAAEKQRLSAEMVAELLKRIEAAGEKLTEARKALPR
ncbi:MAG: hypothetical protein WBF17_01435 [Phycisphaerae bacterium]